MIFAPPAVVRGRGGLFYIKKNSAEVIHAAL